MSVFTCKPRANLNWLFVLGHSLLRPTSNNLKTVLPEILRSLVPECPRVLCLIPDSFSSLGLSRKRTWVMYEKLFHSCSYPFGHWSALNTPCYLCGWASSLSASDLLLLSEEELVHRCHHVSVQINKMFVVLRAVGSAFIVSAVSGTSMSGNVQSWGFMLGEHWRLRSSTGLCVSKGGCGLVGARPYREGRQVQSLLSWWIKFNFQPG